MRYLIEVQGHGGEYTCGNVSDPKEVALLRGKVDSGELTMYNSNDEEGDDYIEVNGYEYTDICHIGGAELEYATLSYTEIDEDNTPIGDVVVFNYNDSNVAELSNPTTFSHEFIEGVILYCYNGERGNFMSYIVETDEPFNVSNLWFGVHNMDETFGDQLIIGDAFYQTPKEMEELLLSFGENIYVQDALQELKSGGEYHEALRELFITAYLYPHRAPFIFKDLELEYEDMSSSTPKGEDAWLEELDR